jgi:hypothetical protein
VDFGCREEHHHFISELPEDTPFLVYPLSKFIEAGTIWKAGEAKKFYFSLTKAAKCLDILPCRNQKWDWWKQHQDKSVLDFIAQHFDIMISWQANLSVDLIIIEQFNKGYHKLLFDGRLWTRSSVETVCWIISHSSGKLCRVIKNDITQIPLVYHSGKRRVLLQQLRSSLCDLINLRDGSKFSDPQSLSELEARLASYQITVVNGPHQNVCFRSGCQYLVAAKTDSKCRIFYQTVDDGKDLKSVLKAEKGEIDEEVNNNDDNDDEATDPWQINHSAAVSACQSGLNLALSLGVISHEEF